MKKAILTIMLLLCSTVALANGHSLFQICNMENGKLLINRSIQNFNVAITGYVNYILSGEGNVWYYLHIEGPPVQGINFQYDFLKVAYITGTKVSVCLNSDGNTLGMERTNGANN